MSFLNALINEVDDEALRELFSERIEIVQHKIKFMDKVAVSCLDAKNERFRGLDELIVAAGGEPQDDPSAARLVIYYEPGTGMLQLMGAVPVLLTKTWPSVEYDRVYLLDDQVAGSIGSGGSADAASAAGAVGTLEDIAEMLHPGAFVFGNEGNTWVSFKTQ